MTDLNPLAFRSAVAALLILATGEFFAAKGHAQADYKRFFDEENVPAVWEIFHAGRYDLCEQICEIAEQRGQPSVEWRIIKFRSLEAQGDYDEAFAEAEKLLVSFPDEIHALMQAHDLFARFGKSEQAEKMLAAVNEAALGKKRKDRTGRETVALGRAALALGADPQKVMQQYFDPVKAKKPKSKDDIPEGLLEAHIAAGELALEKSDFKRAASEFTAALKYEPNDPNLRFGVAAAFFPSDRSRAEDMLARAIDANPVHAPSVLLLAETRINSEQYQAAEQMVSRIHSYNEKHPLAWAYQAVIANLARNDLEEMDAARERALQVWTENPEVDHTIGRVLSRNYRFSEGAAHQKRALEFDPDYLPARLQLAHDYLRLGNEEEAWKLAEEVGEADPYEVLAYNLTILRDQIAEFHTIESPDFTIRMPENEAKIYGDRALEILTESKKVLCEKYGLDLKDPVLVEFFPQQQDFAIRTFGNLGGAGILGACFGTVVTMNSPGGLAHGRNNWEATLWHEFCHVVTLTVTKNKMPRWLSEGISVYEEIQRNPAWGQKMTPRYRQMILDEDALTPISKLSSAFTNPKSGEHVMFAYYQSMLVVDYLIEQYGIARFRKILTDLAGGVLINDAIARNTTALPKLEAEFADHVIKMAENLAPGVDWTQPDPAVVDPRNAASVALFAEQNPKSYWAVQAHTRNLLGQERWQEALEWADKLIALYPENVQGGNGYEMKAAAYRALENPKEEAAALRQLAKKSSEAHGAYARLLDLDLENEKWEELKQNAGKALAINPFMKRIHYCRGCALEAQKEAEGAVESFEKLLILKPANPSEVRFRLARLLKPEDEERSKRYLLDALAEAPRYREAHELLLSFQDANANAEEGEASEPALPSPAAPAKPGFVPKVMKPKSAKPAPAPKKEADPFGSGSPAPAPKAAPKKAP